MRLVLLQPYSRTEEDHQVKCSGKFLLLCTMRLIQIMSDLKLSLSS
jgi:hypothetical protein